MIEWNTEKAFKDRACLCFRLYVINFVHRRVNEFAVLALDLK